jgi:hypothetical protein
MPLVFEEDNETAIHIMKTGKNPNMRYMTRTQGICCNWLKERFDDPQITLQKCDTHDMAADIFTTCFTDAMKWQHDCSLIGMSQPVGFKASPKEGLLPKSQGGVLNLLCMTEETPILQPH